MDQVKIGQFIAALRREQGLTQEALGEKLGVTNKTVSRWENGNYMPDIEMLLLLGQTFSVSINELLAGQRLTEAEFREKAEENMTAVLRESSFTRKEQEGFWKKKWKKDHLSDILVTAVMTLLVYWALPRILHAETVYVWCTLPIAAIVEYCIFRSRMMSYVEEKLYSGTNPLPCSFGEAEPEENGKK